MATPKIYLFGVLLFWIGAVLWVNGIALLGKADYEGLAPLNFFVGLLSLFINVIFIVDRPFGTPESYWYGAMGLLFAFTYLYNGFNYALGYDGRGLGWFCLFVAISTIPTGLINLGSDWRFAVFWWIWGALWFVYFLLLSLGDEYELFGSERFAHFSGYATVAVAVVTCWIPGYMMLRGMWGF